ncbi:hypothetical protein [Streptomyces sp. NPDC088246]|uniref:hypothetical protein n=1 Tax=Streptomyces sp. NPDC088246 TaxID=3365842 RepID=UPI00382617C5
MERELREETGWEVKAGDLLDTWIYEPLPGRRVLIVTYDCTVLTPDKTPVVISLTGRTLPDAASPAGN